LTPTTLITGFFLVCVVGVSLWPQTPISDPHIVVYKRARKLELYSGKTLVRTYRVGLGFNPIDDKKREGDGATPEGEFYVFVKNNKSAYYLSLGISSPGRSTMRLSKRSGRRRRRRNTRNSVA
jgi:murein L,D-transpeptidase YafK